MRAPSRLLYRARQFRLALLGPRPPVPEQALSPQLSPALITLFRRMQPSEQAHSLAVRDRLIAGGWTDPDLLTAALLHDVGKVRFPLRVWDRVLVVVAKRLAPRLVHRLATGEPGGLRRPFVVALRHAEWGADLAAQAGATPGSVALIRRHQEPAAAGDTLLQLLQQADEHE